MCVTRGLGVRTHNGLGTQETTRSDHDPRPGIPTPSQKLQSRVSSLGFPWDGTSCGKSWDKKKSFSSVTLSQDKGRSELEFFKKKNDKISWFWTSFSCFRTSFSCFKTTFSVLEHHCPTGYPIHRTEVLL